MRFVNKLVNLWRGTNRLINEGKPDGVCFYFTNVTEWGTAALDIDQEPLLFYRCWERT